MHDVELFNEAIGDEEAELYFNMEAGHFRKLVNKATATRVAVKVTTLNNVLKNFERIDFFKNVAYIIAVNHFLVTQLIVLGLPKEKLVTIVYGIDLSFFPGDVFRWGRCEVDTRDSIFPQFVGRHLSRFRKGVKG